METPKSTWFIELLKVLVWPVFCLFAVVAFWDSLQGIARALPSILKDTETITIGGVTVSVRNAISEKASTKLRAILPRLSSDTFEYLLKNDSTTYYNEGGDLGAEERELVTTGLCTTLSKEALAVASKDASLRDKEKRVYASGFECGDLYFETRKFLVDLIPELVRQAMPKEKRSEKGK